MVTFKITSAVNASHAIARPAGTLPVVTITISAFGKVRRQGTPLSFKILLGRPKCIFLMSRGSQLFSVFFLSQQFTSTSSTRNCQNIFFKCLPVHTCFQSLVWSYRPVPLGASRFQQWRLSDDLSCTALLTTAGYLCGFQKFKRRSWKSLFCELGSTACDG